MASSITPGQALSDLEKGISIAGDTISGATDIAKGVNSVASGNGVSGAAENDASGAAQNAGAIGTIASGGTPTYGLSVGNVSGLLTRFLKIVIGGVFVIAGVLKLTGKQDVVTKLGTKVVEGMLLA